MTKTVELKNSDIVYFNEFLGILRRKEYNSNQVHRFFRKINRRWNPKKLCHMCGKQMNSLLTQVLQKCFCSFCMEYVCSAGCLSKEKFIIPRLFNLNYDMQEKPVCQLAAVFLQRKNIIKIKSQHP